MIAAASPSELVGLVGSRATGDWFDIDQDRIDAFARVTEDLQLIHVDRDRAADGPYGTTIAHGMLTLSLLPPLLAQLIDVHDIDAVVNYGLDAVRFISAVPSGSRIRARTELVAAELSPRGIRATLRTTVELEGSVRPALVAETIHLFVSAAERNDNVQP